MSTMVKMCRICRLDTPNLIDLKYKDEAMGILDKLKVFIDLNAMEQDPKAKFICMSCYDTLQVAYDFKQKCDKSMAASRLRTAKPSFKCILCPLCFETAKKLEKHSLTHSIDLTEDDQPPDTPSKCADSKKHKNKPKNHDSGHEMRFKIPVHTLKKKTSSSKKDANHNKSAPQRNSESHPKKTPSYSFECPICQHKFLTRAALMSHVRWHDIKELQYKCPSCGISFLQMNHMNEHIRHKH